MTEAELQALITDAADLGGWLWYHTHDSRRSNPGFPDLVLVRPPEMLFIELKSERGRVSPAQRMWLDQIGQIEYISSDVLRPDQADAMIARLLHRPDTLGRLTHSVSDHLIDNVDPAECPDCA